ncbi:MAG: DegV family protein [Clostridia bacterium]|nr:DegV family protein [Clostridia bacterium]
MSKFFCDSNCELDYKVVDELGINLVKMPYTLDGKEEKFDLGREINSRDFFAAMRGGADAKTQALNEYDYIEYFEPVFAAGEDIIYVSFSHAMSGTFSSLKIAVDGLKAKYPERKFTLCNTYGISMGCGIVVYYAAKEHNAGKSDEEVAEFVETFRKRVKCFFTVKDLVYLKRGGRLSAFKAMMGKLLDLKPIIAANEEGKLVNIVNVKGRKKSLHALIDYTEKFPIDENYLCCVMNGDCDEDTKYTVELIREKYPNIEIVERLVGPVIGSHCGPDTVGFIFIAKEQ